MAKKLVHKWANLTLSKEEGATLIVSETEANIGEQRWLIVAKLISARSFNHNALARTMKEVWRSIKGMETRRVGLEILMFEFHGHKDYDRVLNGGPWSVDKNLLVIQAYDGKTRPLAVEFSHALFWIRVLNILLILLTKV